MYHADDKRHLSITEGIKNATDAAAVIFLYAVMQAVGITCPIRFLTGISCAGCGMTRAWLSVLHLDFSAAFAWHPLFWTIPVIVVLFIFRKKLPFRKAIVTLFVALFMVVYIIRMADTSDTVVTCSIRDGFLYKTAAHLLHFIL